jgi:hypothetical protein
MALTIENNIPDYGLVKNFIKLLFETDNRYSTPGTYASIELKFSGALPGDADTFTVEYTDKYGELHTIEFTFTESADLATIYEIFTYDAKRTLDINFSAGGPINNDFFTLGCDATGPGGYSATFTFKDVAGLGEIRTPQGDFIDDWITNEVLPALQASALNVGYNFELINGTSTTGTVRITYKVNSVCALLTYIDSAAGTAFVFMDMVDEYLTNYVLPRLQAVFYLIRDYSIEITASTTTTGTIKLIEREYNALEITPTDAAAGFIFDNNTAGVIPVERENFRLWAEIFVENTFLDGNFAPVHSDDIAFNTDDQAELYTENILKSFLNYDLPAYNASALAYCSNMLKRWYIWYTEAYGTPPVAIEYTRYPASNTEYIYAVMAGQKKATFTLDTYESEYFTGTNNKFLTNQPRAQAIHPAQPVFLNLFINNDQEFSSKIKIYYTDDTNATHTLLTDDTQSGKICIFPAGYNQNTIADLVPAGKTLAYYDFWVEFADTTTSEVFTFTLAHNYSGLVRFYLFQNAWGAFDTLAATGELITINKNSREPVTKIETASDLADNVYFNYLQYEQDTGYITDEMQNHLRELLNAQNVFIDNLTSYQRIILLNDDDLISQDYALLNGLIFKYRTDTLEKT